MMDLQESQVLAQKKAKKDAELKAAEESRKRAMEAKRREQMARENAVRESHKPVDLSELYSNMVPVSENVMTAAELNDYEHHSQYWIDRVDEATKDWDKQFAEDSERLDEAEDPHNVHHYRDQLNFEQEYDGMLLQREYTHHSPYWESRVEEASKDFDKNFEEESDRLDAAENPHNVHHYKDQLNFEDEYDGMLIQRAYAHHTPYWEERVAAAEKDWDKKLDDYQEMADAAENPHNPHFYKTVDHEEEYNGMLLQTGKDYEKHHEWWDERVAEKTKELGRQLAEADEMEKRQSDPAYPEFYGSTINKEEVYNGMLLQYEPEFENHSAFYRQHEMEVEDEWNKEQAAAEQREKEGISVAAAIDKGETPKQEQMKTYRNPSVDLEEEYSGLVQLSDHEGDTDDVVPELSEEVQV